MCHTGMRRNTFNTIFIGLILSFTACTSESEILDEQSSFYPVEPTLVAEGHLFGNGDEGITKSNLIIKTVDDWNALINKMNTVNNESDQFLINNIDFSTHQVIAVFDEVRPSGGFSIELKAVKNNSQTLVQINFIEPTGLVTDIITQPYKLILLPNTLPNVVFN